MRTLIRFILLTVSVIVLFPRKVAEGCGFWVYPGEYRFWLMQPDIVNEPDLTPFYFATSYLYKGNEYAGEQPHLRQNINEWYETVNRKASKKDIDSLLNATPPQEFFNEQKSLLNQNSLMKYLLQPDQKELYQYLLLSKKVEQIAANPDPWDEQNYPKESIDNIITELKKLRGTTISSFIKLRTAFQLMRLYNINAQSKEAEKIYDAWIAPVNTKSWITAAALYQIALNYIGPQGNYLRSKVFDIGGYNRTMCLVRFDSKSTDEALKLTKNQHERNVLVAMKLFNYPGRGLDVIKQIYASEPQYKELPFLLLREINKVEDWLLTNKITSFQTPAVYGTFNYDYLDNAGSNYRNDKAYAQELSSFLHNMVVNSVSQQKAILILYAAHIDMLNKDYLSSATHLKEASLQKHLPQNIKTQIAINRYLLHLENGFDKNNENEFMTIIKTPDQKLGIYDPGIMKNQLILYTARKMINKGDKARGILLLSKTNRAFGELPISGYKTVYQEIEENANEEDFYTMLNIFDKKNKSPFEKFVCEKKIHSPMEIYEWYEEDSTSLKWDRSKLLNCLASWYLRQHRLTDAYAILKKIPVGFFERYPYKDYISGNPFYLNVYRAHTVTKEDKQSLNETQVVEEMLHLEVLAKKDKSKAAECYYQLANAWYNMSYYGKNWLMVKQWWSINEPDTWNGILKKSPFNGDYYGCRYAKSYYDKAIEASKDKRLTALCFFMSNRCEANYQYYIKLVRGQEDVIHDYSPDYPQAKNEGIDQEYYKQIVEECETYQSFIRRYNKEF
ncbi:MAG: hypothetical protein ABIN97_15720 [Ginsengibacter sp.]